MIRTIKLQPAHRQGKWDKCPKLFPSLHLEGSWLDSAGFKLNDQVNVEVLDNKLIITPVREIDDQALMELFREQMDQICFPGYTDEVLLNDSERFKFEFDQFKKCYA